MTSEKNKGIAHVLGAYVIWGLFPVYFKQLQHVPALEIIGHRIVWSCVILFGVILLWRQWRVFRTSAANFKVLRSYTIAAVLIAINWLMFVWAVNNGHVLQASLGYFITPLINVLLGVVFLRERLRLWQWISIGLAASGVLYLAIAHGALPWIALTLAFSFGLYALIKKTAPLGAVHGLTIETGILLLPALIYLLYLGNNGTGTFLHANLVSDLFLIGAGIATTVPLLLFASATQRIPLSLIGVLQYLTPTLHFLIGIWIYHEPFTGDQVIGFGIVWVALAIFILEGFFVRSPIAKKNAVRMER